MIELSRLDDLAKKSYNQNIYTFSNFLGLSEQDQFKTHKKDFDYAGWTLFGGFKDCERVMVRFGDAKVFGYEDDFPIVCLSISPRMEKFSQELSHRDYLGALMNLGIERELLGDILIRDKCALLFCKETIAEYICENLTKVRHTYVDTKVYEGDIREVGPRLLEVDIQVSSVRLDGILAKAFKLSRESIKPYFAAGKVFINGKNTNNTSAKPREQDIISLRGYGRIKYIGELKTTKKGNLLIRVEKFI